MKFSQILKQFFMLGGEIYTRNNDGTKLGGEIFRATAS